MENNQFTIIVAVLLLSIGLFVLSVINMTYTLSFHESESDTSKEAARVEERNNLARGFCFDANMAIRFDEGGEFEGCIPSFVFPQENYSNWNHEN